MRRDHPPPMNSAFRRYGNSPFRSTGVRQAKLCSALQDLTSNPHPAAMTQHSNSIRPVDHENGSVFTFSRMFGTHGPHLIDGKRLDQLTGVDLLLDSSTSVVSQTSYATTTSNATGVLGRAVVGGLVAGGVGALVGGTTGAKTTTSAGSSVESINTQLTVKLTFEAGQTIHAVVTDLAAYHWLLSFPGKPPPQARSWKSPRPNLSSQAPPMCWMKGLSATSPTPRSKGRARCCPLGLLVWYSWRYTCLHFRQGYFGS